MKQGPSHTILAVNDRKDQLTELASAIELAEYAVLKATNVSAAIRLATEQQPDLIIIDVSKKQTALDLHRRLRSNHNVSDVPILLITADSEEHPNSFEIDSTKDDVLETPYHPITLAAKVARLVERKRTQDAQQRYFELFHNANDVVYTHDLEGRYTSLNKRGQQITGYSPDEIADVKFSSLASPEDVALAHDMLRKKLNGDATNTIYELSVKKKDGTWTRFEVNSQLIFEKGKPVGVQGIARDISARQEAEEKLRQAQKMEAIGLLAGGVAHDFNNILTAIYGSCDSLLLALEPENTQPVSVKLAYSREQSRNTLPVEHQDTSEWIKTLRKHVSDIQQSGRSAASLTKKLLAYSRKQVLQPVNLNLNTVVTNMEEMIRRTIGDDISITLNLVNDLPQITADRNELEQIIINLAINARDAMPNGGTITIETSVVHRDKKQGKKHTSNRTSYVQLSITDTGIGMSSEIQQHIFEPFFTTKTEGKGTGLGLAHVWGCVDQSEGFITVSSKEGEGTTFNIQFPIGQSTSLETSIDLVLDLNETIQGTQTVLIAEDNPDVRQRVKDWLTGAGYTTLEAIDGVHALELLNDQQIHLLITDVLMPNMNGRDLALRILDLRPTAQVLFISGYPTDIITDRGGVLIEGVHFLSKPFNRNELLHSVSQILTSQEAA
jgi:PAS domain S-box-containing protein